MAPSNVITLINTIFNQRHNQGFGLSRTQVELIISPIWEGWRQFTLHLYFWKINEPYNGLSAWFTCRHVTYYSLLITHYSSSIWMLNLLTRNQVMVFLFTYSGWFVFSVTLGDVALLRLYIRSKKNEKD